MKAKMGILLALVLGYSGAALAVWDYIPPERLRCVVDGSGKLACLGFNRHFLIETSYSPHLTPGEPVVFNFATGSAFETYEHSWTVYYTYKDAFERTIKLKTINPLIRPVMHRSGWANSGGYYACTEGYMSCPITDRPEKKS